MALNGTLRDFGLADIFQLIGLQRKTGVLSLRSGDTTVTVSFLSGGVVSADSSERPLEDRLGSVLVKSGKVTERQLSEALKSQKTSLQRLGKILIEQRSISAEELHEALRVQVTQIIHHLFRWKDGAYHFSQEGTIDYDREYFTPIAAENILMEGARMIDEWPIIERRITTFQMILKPKADARRGDHGPISVYETDIDFGLIEDPDRKAEDERVRLSKDEAAVYRLVEGRSTVQDIIDQSQIGEFETCKILYELLSRELVEEGLSSVTPAAAVAAPPQRTLALKAGLILLPAIALVSAYFALASPLAPTGTRAHDPFGVDRIRVHLSQAQVGRIDKAVRLYHMDRQTFPVSMDQLVREGFLQGKDLVDPWGRPYRFHVESSGYLIQGHGPGGLPDDSISLKTPFGASERLAIEGGVDGPQAKVRR
jgi:hypothetical protein